MAYVKVHHTTGVTWNPKGGDAGSYTPATSAAAAASPAAAAPSAPVGTNSVFAGIRSIDQSEGHTAGLRKVTKEQQTWRKEYQGVDAPAPAAPAPKSAAAKAPVPAPKIAKTPVCEVRNGNWQIEYQTAAAPLTVSDINMKQQVYIYGCENATIILEGKAKSIIFDSCKKTKLIFDDAVSSIEIVNSKNVQVQSKGRVPSVAIDKTDGCLVYISWEGRDVQFVTSKSSEMNVAFPSGPGSDEYVEKPIPEQFVHRITADLTISSDVSDLYTH
jgi:adenylyl cyclase-associated protein